MPLLFVSYHSEHRSQLTTGPVAALIALLSLRLCARYIFSPIGSVSNWPSDCQISELAI